MLRFRLLCVFAILAASTHLAGAQTSGSLGFARWSDYALDHPFSLAAGDFNGDGKTDVAATAFGDGTVNVLPGNGDGTFAAAVSSATGDSSRGLIASDFNKDGKLDVAVLNNFEDGFKVLLGNGDGSFQPPVAYELASTVGSMVAADVNGDGNPDLAAASVGEQAVAVLLGNGDGTFQPQVLHAQNQIHGASLAVSDLNADGKLDVVAASGDGGASVLLGNGDGTFQEPINYPVDYEDSLGGVVRVGDLNGDGVPDVVVGNLTGFFASVLLGNGDGSLQPAVLYSMNMPPANLAIGDLNGDGIPDLAEGDGYSMVLVAIGNGDGTFQDVVWPVGRPEGGSLLISELNGDGRADLVTVSVTVAVWLQGDPVSLQMSSDDDPVKNGESILTARVTPSTPGEVTFRAIPYHDADTPEVDLGTVPLDGGVATVFASGLKTWDEYLFIAILRSPGYASNFASIISAVVPGHDMPPSITLSSDAVDNTSLPGATVTFTATVTGFDPASPGFVTFYVDDSDNIGGGLLSADGVATTSISSLSIGAHTVMAFYDPVGLHDLSSSASLVHTVGIAGPATSTTLTSSANPSNVRQAVTFIATVSNRNGAQVPTGLVKFLDSTTVLATKPLQGGTASYTATNLSAGSHVVTATFVGNATFPASTSNAIDQDVRTTVSSLAVTPSLVFGTSSAQGTIQLTGPAPAAGLDVEITSFPFGVVTAPSIVAVPAGATTATFAITTADVTATTVVTVYASAHGITKNDSLTVKAIALTSFTDMPRTVSGGNPSTGKVTINAAAPAEGKVITLVSDNASVTVPATVTIPAGATQATFTVTTIPVAAEQIATLTAALNGIAKTATVTVTSPALKTLQFAPMSVTGTTGTVTLTSAAPAGGTAVALSSNHPSMTVPAAVVVAPGMTTATFAVTVLPGPTAIDAVISATLDVVTRSVTLRIRPIAPASVQVTMSALGGVAATGTVTLTTVAPGAGWVVSLASDSAAASVPPVVIVPGGMTTVTFPIATSPVAADVTATITAAVGSVTKSDTIVVRPPTVATFSVASANVIGGTSTTGILTITGAAPAGGIDVALTNANPAATVPSTVTIPAGQNQVTFEIVTTAVLTSTAATISATRAGITRRASLTVMAAVMSSVTVTPSPVQGGGQVTVRVTMTGPAPAGGRVVTLTSSKPATAPVPATVTIPDGESFVDVAVTTSVPAVNTNVMISANAGGTKSATFTVTR